MKALTLLILTALICTASTQWGRGGSRGGPGGRENRPWPLGGATAWTTDWSRSWTTPYTPTSTYWSRP
ncbi:hypothetical protein GCK32_011621 [Trichostrongylus colubriformis]|uniref:Uncharacterized protein n=1 Tax=Trichostrongylus colubriformis TaxID=6319 RepID=A0AAN8EXT4_TRICO